MKGGIYKALDRAVTEAGVPCQALPDDAIAAPNPVIVVAVLSPGTPSTDTGGKLADYWRPDDTAGKWQQAVKEDHLRHGLHPERARPIAAPSIRRGSGSSPSRYRMPSGSPPPSRIRRS